MDLAPQVAAEATNAVVSRMVGGDVVIFDSKRVALARLPIISVVPSELGASTIEVGSTVAVADGVASKFAIFDRRGAPVLVGTIGTSKRADMLLSQRGIEQGAEVRITEMVYLQEAG